MTVPPLNIWLRVETQSGRELTATHDGTRWRDVRWDEVQHVVGWQPLRMPVLAPDVEAQRA